MKLLFIIFGCLLLIQSNVAQQQVRTEEIETVAFCTLVASPNLYEGKLVRTTAIFAFGGEDHLVLYCPACFLKGVLRPDFSESFDRRTKGKYKNMISRQKNANGSVKVEMVGRLRNSHFEIEYFETADFLTNQFQFPDRLSESDKAKVNCEPRSNK